MKNSAALFLIIILSIIACSPSKDPAGNGSNKTDSIVTNPSRDPFLKNGEEKTKYTNGVIKTLGNYVNGKMDGQWYSWYSTGKPWSETFFEKGIKSGPTKTWYDNGSLRYEGQYAKDAQTGTWKYYDEKGNLLKTIDHTKK
jgi:antitoxin component YwqK of YwqJK toxin-antitoxin module